MQVPHGGWHDVVIHTNTLTWMQHAETMRQTELYVTRCVHNLLKLIKSVQLIRQLEEDLNK